MNESYIYLNSENELILSGTSRIMFKYACDCSRVIHAPASPASFSFTNCNGQEEVRTFDGTQEGQFWEVNGSNIQLYGDTSEFQITTCT